jgi:hypothetical protein
MYRPLRGGKEVMKNFVLVLSLVVGSWVLSPTPVAQASWFSNWWSSWSGPSKAAKVKKSKTGQKRVPELDPSAAGGAIVLVLGGVAYIASRRREEELV